MKISKYVTKYELGNYVAYYHSLRMKPVYLSKEEDSILVEALDKGLESNLSSQVKRSLKEYYILVDNDEGILEFVQDHVAKPYICVAYFVLTEQCNLKCKYCFLGNGKDNLRKVTNYPMSKETANKALEFFCRQTQQDASQFMDEKEIIFYGGEPLLNFEVLKYVVMRSHYYQENGELTPNLKFSVITNGTLLDREKIQYFIEHNINVAISIDGASALANSSRIDKQGREIFNSLISKLVLAKKEGLNFGLSITLTENTINDLEGIINLVKTLNVRSVSFNILFKEQYTNHEKSFYVSATNFIIEFYKRTKNKGIYEDRIMRKIKAFVDGGIYFSDCAATSGNQIVITPDGNVGICHGCMENREYFIGNILDDSLIVEKNKDVLNWTKLIPIYKDECQTCPALGICGGGCPINSKKISQNHSILDIDKIFCIHAKKVLTFLIGELLRLMLRKE